MPDMPNSTERESIAGESSDATVDARKRWSTPRVISSSAVNDDTRKFPEHESLSDSVHLS
jgi:hypothetical protein